MKTILTIKLLALSLIAISQPAPEEILKKVDANMSSNSRVFESEMTIHGRRSSRTMTSRTYAVGDTKAYTEYLSPPREQGTKMLKLDNQLWVYSPSTDRTIQISGHMLRQSVMGSDLSYEDMMEDRELSDIYTAVLTGNEVIEGRNTFVLELTANVDDVAYARRIMWIDAERYVPLKEELFAKSGQLLKRAVMSDVTLIQGRWFPATVVYKDMLKQGEGTVFKITSIRFNEDIPDYIFSKAVLKQ